MSWGQIFIQKKNYHTKTGTSSISHWGQDKWLPFCRRYFIFLNKNFWISNDISLKCVPYGIIDHMSTYLNQWRCGLLTHICVTQTQWDICLLSSCFTSKIFHHNSNSALIQFVVDLSLWNFAHGRTAVLSWHVQNSVAIWHHTLKSNFPLNFDYGGKIVYEMGPRPRYHQTRSAWSRIKDQLKTTLSTISMG